MPVVATWSPFDIALDVLVPLGLVATSRPGIVVDLDPDGPTVGTGPSLAQLVEAGPTSTQLEPVPGAAAYLANGGVTAADAEGVVSAFVERWDHVVLKCPPGGEPPPGAVAVVPLLPDPYTRAVRPPVVYQRSAFSPTARPDGPILPKPKRRTVQALLAGSRPTWGDPWLRSLRGLWTA
ncbi:MAG: hypothetical protein QNJ71_02995 [Acidimicrobiia bacterium]|nr:hypothetical protein [Acidimicrobiia bacterium]